MSPTLILALIVIAVGAIVLYRSIRIVPQATADIVERFGRYHRSLNAGLSMVVPFVDQIRSRVDLREQVVPFSPQPVITQENLVVSIDTVIYCQVTDPKAATYEVSNFLTAIEQLTVTTLRNIIGGMDLERTLTSREEISGALRADRDKRASILTAEGERTSAVLRARGEAEATVLRAEADAKAQAARARGQAQAIATVFKAIHEGKPDERLLAYQYLQTLPKIAEGDSNKLWIVPSEMGKVLEGLGGFFTGVAANDKAPTPHPSPLTDGSAPTPDNSPPPRIPLDDDDPYRPYTPHQDR